MYFHLAEQIDFLPAFQSLIKAMRARYESLLDGHRQQKIARKREDIIEALDARVRYDIGETDIIHWGEGKSPSRQNTHILSVEAMMARRF